MALGTLLNVAPMPSCSNFINMCIYVCARALV